MNELKAPGRSPALGPTGNRGGWTARWIVAAPLLVVRRIPFSLLMIGIIVLLAYRTGSVSGDLSPGIRERWGYDLENLRHGRVWVLVSSEVLTGYPDHVRNTILMLIAWLVPYEAVAGTGRALAAYWAGTLIGTGSAALISLVLIQTINWDRAPDLVYGADVGASVGAWGVAGALNVWLVSRGSIWRALGLVIPIGGLLYLGNILATREGISDIAHPIGMATGLAVSAMVTHRRNRGAAPRPYPSRLVGWRRPA